MAHLPFYKRYPRDFVEGTVGLSFEVKTTYAFLLDLIYMYGGKLPDDPRYISGQLNCSVRKWNSIRNTLVELGKIQINSDFIVNYRAVIELESLSKYQDKQRENRSKPNKNNNVKSPRSDHTETDTDNNPKSLKKGTEYSDQFEELWKLWNSKLIKPRGDGKSKTQKLFSLKAKKTEPSKIINAAKSYLAQHTTERDRGFISGLSVWLNKERYDVGDVSETVSVDENWGRVMANWMAEGYWPSRLGPKPTEQGCRCPQEYLVKAET